MSETVGYSGTPLPRKLGIKAEHLVLLVGAPDGFELGPLPDGVTVHHTLSRPSRPSEPSRPSRSGQVRYDVVLVFCPDLATLERWFAPLKATLAPASALWVAWPKKASKVATDLDDDVVRGHGLAQGLVDVKVCAIDAVWSGEKFVYRVADRPRVSRTQA